jgi:formate/nitrite transporter|mmetsp:Transcript_88665/g.250957  ORF Transcript_88665/g.250957 Transcript_88665/m.250957 type:complete len:299 (+) Transcript_88665:134-1030(+)
MPELMSIVKTPKEAFMGMVDKGVGMGGDSSIKIFHQSFYAGCYIGFGGMLSMVVAGGLDSAAQDNPTIQTFVFAALFPVNLLLILLTGGVLITGTAATVPAAVFEGKLHRMQILRTFALAWVGNLLGALLFAGFVTACNLNVGLTASLARKVAEKKIKENFLVTFLKGIGCNWLVCMAVFLQGQAQDMVGKMVGIWFPISCFVAIGFEHIPANMFMIPMGMMAGADVSVLDCLWRNFIPVTLGNIFAGSIFVGGGYSFAFGRLGSSPMFNMPAKEQGSPKDQKPTSDAPAIPPEAQGL